MKIKAKIETKILNNRLPIADLGGSDVSIILAGMGRSGTTWGGNIINYNNNYRILFEPFLPAKVIEAKEFEYIQYINPNSENDFLAKQARKILSGKIRNDWVDRDNNKWFYSKRIIKDIRINLMLGWLKKISNNPPVVLMIRHPLQVVSSWNKLGWGKEVMGKRSDLEIIMAQNSLLSDFPIINEIYHEINLHDDIEKILFQWCIMYYVPLMQLHVKDVYVLHYENLIVDQDNEIRRLFEYLNIPVDLEIIKNNIRKTSSTNFNKRDLNADNTINSWKDEFSAVKIDKAVRILNRFGLDDLYNKDGLPTGESICLCRK